MQYITNAGIILTGCFLFYKLLLQKETFFRANRWILLACLALSFSLPLIKIPQQWSLRGTETVQESPVTDATPTSPLVVPSVTQPAGVEPSTTQPATPATQVTPATTNNTRPSFSWQQALTWIGYLYWFGVIVFAGTFLVQIITLLYRAYTSPVIKDGRFRIIELSGDKAPCSFLNNIFINPEKYDWDTYNQILQHEKIHIEQKHSLDLMLAELVIVFQWFNPFAWKYRKALEDNLEYLTDDQLVNHYQVEKEAYQLSLLRVSAPHFPLALTTNYNQSLLKKRIAMMNVKKSNLHTAWKYCFLLPVLVLFVCLLNEPRVYANEPAAKKAISETGFSLDEMSTEGVWFATIKGTEVTIQFKHDGDDHSTNSNTFQLSELGDLPKDKAGVFSATREAGTMQFTGRFEDGQGMGRYKFTPAAGYADKMKQEGIEMRNDNDVMIYFLVNVTGSYVKMLKAQGYTNLNRNDVIPLAALRIDEAYITGLKASGIRGLTLKDIVPFKALGVNGDYIAEIRKAGYPDVSASQLISFKAQGIDAKYIADVRSAKASLGEPARSSQSTSAGSNKADRNKDNDSEVSINTNTNSQVNVNPQVDVSINDLIAIKSLNINETYIKSLADAGMTGLTNQQLISMKSQGITGEYIKGLRTAGFKDLRANDIISIKSLGVDAEFVKSIHEAGFTEISNSQLMSFKSLGITGAYIKSLKAAGYDDIRIQEVTAFKAQGITPEFAASFAPLGYKNIPAREIISLKSLGVTPEFVKGFKDAGVKEVSLNQAIGFKAQSITPALFKEYNELGFGEVSINDVVAAKATGTTPAFVTAMKQKGHNFKTLQKYVQLKTIID